MHLRILGSAAGGRFPQWNCGCVNCAGVRKNARKDTSQLTFAGKLRTQAQLALSCDGSAWFLAGASPDLAFQIESTPALHPRTRRDSPVAGVVLASADLDHVLGLLLLRELQPLRVCAAPSILRVLREENSMFSMLNRVDPQVIWTPIKVGAPFPLHDAAGNDLGLCCEAYPLGGRYPKYVRTKDLPPEHAASALFFTSRSVTSQVAKRVGYLPAVGKLDDALLAKLDGLDVLLFDGTFWNDDELTRLDPFAERAHQMGHIPVEESLRLLKKVNVGRRIYIHINNTNPILNEAGPEHRAVRAAGWEIAEDNWHLEL
jgi:pyrroloquinoline quinone biosynthesis protein B